ncbi:hypothetical protein EFK50_01375 [Nocardioides marmoriginsengisoli]|uniref:Uncharacterized protein n=1 Tax=Nocardioides marmoriginsengisoli TaxID=661483 RepID=A0A3N0CQI9_9ACTN|nr:hypothetical protein [Nocardioides marmoriginsengisoli]RNL65727.1 hypothetical protein EFK50_01375 [Nocardioides marmoriginsengisoli]
MIAYGANASDTTVHSDGHNVDVFLGSTCVLSFRHENADEAAWQLIQMLTTELGRSFDRID